MPALYGLQPRQAYYRTIDDRQDRMWTSSCGHSSVGLLPIGREAVHKLCSSSQASDAVFPCQDSPMILRILLLVSALTASCRDNSRRGVPMGTKLTVRRGVSQPSQFNLDPPATLRRINRSCTCIWL